MKRGFTLAEVLITLTIIGIIAALTLPGLKSNMGARKAASWYAKYCNILDGAIRQAMFANDLEHATDITTAQLYAQLQGIDVDNAHERCEMKDGSLVHSIAEDYTIQVDFPESLNITSRIYTIDNSMEGIDCREYGALG